MGWLIFVCIGPCFKVPSSLKWYPLFFFFLSCLASFTPHFTSYWKRTTVIVQYASCAVCIQSLPHFFQTTTRMITTEPKTTRLPTAVRAGWKSVFSPVTGPGKFLTWPRPKKCTHINQYAVIKGFPHTLNYTYLVLCWRVRRSWTEWGRWIDE